MSFKTTRNASEYHHFSFCLSFYDYKWPWCRLACWEHSISQLSVFDFNLTDTNFSVWAKNSVSMRNHRVFTVQTVPNVSVSIHGLLLNEIKSFLWIPAAIEAFKDYISVQKSLHEPMMWNILSIVSWRVLGPAGMGPAGMSSNFWEPSGMVGILVGIKLDFCCFCSCFSARRRRRKITILCSLHKTKSLIFRSLCQVLVHFVSANPRERDPREWESVFGDPREFPPFPRVNPRE